MEMQGRQDEGIDLLEKHERYFAGGSNVIHHLWWHRAMFHLERREFKVVLSLYNQRFRNLASPCVPLGERPFRYNSLPIVAAADTVDVGTE
jgi:hypothetical protein